ncbi:MAG TPA: glycosyltransferase family 2 protein [Candidatus Saccharimonadia bacterium]|nr:glycosyltransferase family 2 protein [Candidatus Saccharimonadia bacterium]
MKKSLLEIPFPSERGFRYRFFEILPGALSYFVLSLPLLLSLISPYLTVYFILGFLFIWFTKAIGLDVRAVQGYRMIKKHEKLPWSSMLKEITSLNSENTKLPKWHKKNIKRIALMRQRIMPEDLYHVFIVATYNEKREVIEPTIVSITKSNYDLKRVILVIAYEERGGPDIEKQTIELINEYGHYFKHAMAVKHPENIPGEVIGKGGNISCAGKELLKYVEEQNIDTKNVLVTTLDSDNRPHHNYLASLSYLYCSCSEPKNTSFQPVPMFTNNIWDAPAPMRVIATGNSFWMTVSSMRPHALRNFSAHAQSLEALADTNFWSTRTIVEDGHQFWRTYFRYNGKHEVFPVYVPIYQDAVLSKTYIKTLKSQFIQLRRWAWGASDIAYVVDKGFFNKDTENKVPKKDLIFKLLQLIEGHVSWATAPVLIAFSAFVPAFVHPQNYAANLLPIIVSRMQTIALLGIFITLFFSLKILPPKPKYYRKHRTFFMIIQWVYLPVTTIVYNAMAGLYSQTRLMFGKYIDKFDVTEKAVYSSKTRKKI